MQILVGDFTENDLKNGIDKIEVEKAKKKHDLKYTNTKIIVKKGIRYLRIYVCDVYSFNINI